MDGGAKGQSCTCKRLVQNLQLLTHSSRWRIPELILEIQGPEPDVSRS